MEQQEHSVSFFRFEDLRVYRKAVDYAVWLSAALREPRNEAERSLYGLFVRSAYNISVVIAEGSSRNKRQFQDYLKNAKTAVRECVIFTEIAKKNGIISPESYDYSRELLMELTRMVGALIISLQRSSHRDNDELDFGNDDNATDEEDIE